MQPKRVLDLHILDFALFRSALLNPYHILHDPLPRQKVTPYNMRSRPLYLTLPRVDAFAKGMQVLFSIFFSIIYI